MSDKYIMLDFAETLGYRTEGEYEGDLQIVTNKTGSPIEKVKEANEKIRKQLDIYDRAPQWYESIEKERERYIRYFKLVLTELGQNPESAPSIVDAKFNAIRHAAYEDVQDFFEQTKDAYRFLVVSDGMPSRRMTIKNLGLDKYLTRMYTSDETGMFKSDPTFFQKVFADLGITDPHNVYLVDDSVESVESAKTQNINTFLVDRKGKIPGAFSSLLDIATMLKLQK